MFHLPPSRTFRDLCLYAEATLSSNHTPEHFFPDQDTHVLSEIARPWASPVSASKVTADDLMCSGLLENLQAVEVSKAAPIGSKSL